MFLSHTAHGWTWRGSEHCWVSPDVMTEALPPVPSTAASLRSQKPRGELLLETVTGPWRTGAMRIPLLLSGSSIYPVVLQFTLDHNLCECTCQCFFAVHIHTTFADRRILWTFFVSFYLKVVVQADLCAGLLFPVRLSERLQLQLLLLVLSSQTLLLWQQQS